MKTEFSWDGHFWTQTFRLPYQDTELELRIYTDGENHLPSERQLAVAGRVPGYLAGVKEVLDERAEAYCRRIDDCVGLAQEGVVIDYDRISKHYVIKSVLVGHVDDCAGEYFFLS